MDECPHHDCHEIAVECFLARAHVAIRLRLDGLDEETIAAILDTLDHLADAA